MEIKIKCGNCKKVFAKEIFTFNRQIDGYFKCIFCKTKNKISLDDRSNKNSKNIIDDKKLKIQSEKEHNLKMFGRFISNKKIRKRVTVQLSEEDKMLLNKIPNKKNYSSLNIKENFEKYGVRKSNKEIRALLDLPDYKKQIALEKNKKTQQDKQFKRRSEIIEKQKEEARRRVEEEKNFADTGIFETDKERELRLNRKGEFEKEQSIQENINKYTKELNSVFPKENISIDIHNLLNIWSIREEWEQQNRFTKIKFKNGIRIAIKPCPIACSSAIGRHKYLFNQEGIDSLNENQKDKFSTYSCKNGFGYHLSSNKKDKNGNEVYEEPNWEEYL